MNRRDPSGPVEPRRTPSVGEAEVRRLAELAALDLSDREVDRLAGELAEILDHFEALREGTEGAEGTEGLTAESAEGAEGSGEHSGGAGLRADEVGPDPIDGEPGAQARRFEDGFFTVPRLASHGGADTEEEGSA